MDWKDKIVLITGASSGIGYAVSAELVKAGAKVYSMSRSVPEVKVEGVTYLKADLTLEADVEKAVAQVPGEISLLMNNAGMMMRGNYWEINVEDFDKVWAVDVRGLWLMFKYTRERLAKGAMTVQTNSKNCRSLKADTFIYTLSKNADLVIDQIVAKDRPDLDMRVAYFGPVDTPLEWTGYNAEQKAKKMEVALTPVQAGKQMMELLNSDKKMMIYDEAANNYSLE